MSTPSESTPPEIPSIKPGELDQDEVWWRDHQVWLQERGYLLRPRYRPDWVPSWLAGKGKYYDYEDGQRLPHGQLIDAMRVADGATVVLKQVLRTEHPYEVAITGFLTSESLKSNPKNHCVPIHEVLQVPEDGNIQILVMPLLRKFYDPRFLTVGEAVEFCRQAFEGLQFIHEHHVAHRDISDLNIMMDPRPLFPQLFHFARPSETQDMRGTARYYTRTRYPVKYYFIDFGLSRKFDPAAGPPRSRPIWGGDRSVPEFHRSLGPCDPFPTDIYYIGNVVRTVLLQEYRGLDFMQPLVDEMVQTEPGKRPTIQEVVSRFELLMGSLSTWRLRSRLATRNENWLIRSIRVIAHAFRTIFYVLIFRPALPKP
ncbi:kinase-like domain-containing protein [Dichomitus squalens]|uniref:Kinase-like domain-containing protein n=1 Tax=Dichomitus squalens TaxID=114155 RepID=A0A4Q9Q9X3_9APHY|nr:kinase-like domain-containing protein [Dichomitus squalens]TBU64369.1 kinase-like domain-containing protein [Dichomitus squalens]